MQRKICILDLTSCPFLEKCDLKIYSVNPGQAGFSLVLVSFSLCLEFKLNKKIFLNSNTEVDDHDKTEI